MRRLDAIDDIKDYISHPRKIFVKKQTCPAGIVAVSVFLALLIGAILYMALKYKRDQEYFDDYEDFDLDDDVLYAKESDFDE